jgi:predicted Zn-dependent protease with MMP-like domain
MPCHLSKAQFARAVEDALAELPEPFASHLEQITVEITDRPTRKQLRAAGLEEDELLFGLYQGVSLPERSVEHSGVLPDRILIFQEDHELACDDPKQLVEEIRKTVLHEIGHHFGMDEDDLDEAGYG